VKTALILCITAVLCWGCASENKEQSTTGSKSAVAPARPSRVVLDVRTPAEYASGHIDGALNLPIDELATRIGSVVPDKDTSIKVHCQSGGRSARAKKLLDQWGYANVEDLGSLAHAREVLTPK
jgi:phage shock protein E